MDEQQEKYEQKDNEGALFGQDKTKETQPDVRGPALINGTEYTMSGWYNQSKKDERYLKLRFEVKPEVQAGLPPEEGGEKPWL